MTEEKTFDVADYLSKGRDYFHNFYGIGKMYNSPNRYGAMLLHLYEQGEEVVGLLKDIKKELKLINGGRK